MRAPDVPDAPRRWWPRSLRSRLVLGILAVLAVVLLVGGAVVAREADRTERQAVDDRLQRTAELLDQIARDVIERGEEPPTLTGQERRREEDRRLTDVLRTTRSALIVTLGDQPLYEQGIRISSLGPTPLGLSTRESDGRTLRVYTKVIPDDGLGGLTRMMAVTDLRQAESRQTSLRRRLAAVGAAMLLVAALGVGLSSGLVLRPLRRLRAHARGIEDEGDLDTRVPVQGPREVRELAGSFNAMLQRLGRSADERNQALAATRRFAADVGHELRTPLTSVQNALSTIHRHPDAPVDTRTMIVGDALDEHRRLVLLLDGLQALARGDANTVAQEDVDLASVAADAVSGATGEHPATTFEARLPDDAVVVHGWEPGLRSLIDNLLRNAARHGRAGGRVVLTVHPAGAADAPGGDASTDAVGAGAAAPRGPAGPVLTVDDDGPGVPPEERERIFAPFARAAGTVAPGSGLGLAIVAQQAGHHGASVAVDASPAGGARFVVRFPG